MKKEFNIGDEVVVSSVKGYNTNNSIFDVGDTGIITIIDIDIINNEGMCHLDGEEYTGWVSEEDLSLLEDVSKFKVGDKVKLKDDLKPHVAYDGIVFAETMNDYKYTTLTISDISFGQKYIPEERSTVCAVRYEVEEDENNFVYTDEMLEKIDEEEDTLDNLSKFQIGDRVQSYQGKGTIIDINTSNFYINGQDYLVEYDEEIPGGHNGNLIIGVKGKDRHCWWEYGRDLKLMDSPKESISNSLTDFKIGDRVQHKERGNGIIIDKDTGLESSNEYLVEYDETVAGGHDGGIFTSNNGKHGYCWWEIENDIELIETNDITINKKPKFKVGDKVRLKSRNSVITRTTHFSIGDVYTVEHVSSSLNEYAYALDDSFCRCVAENDLELIEDEDNEFIKYHHLIERITATLDLAREDNYKDSLMALLEDEDSLLNKDIDMLCELDWLLRVEQLEISRKETSQNE